MSDIVPIKGTADSRRRSHVATIAVRLIHELASEVTQVYPGVNVSQLEALSDGGYEEMMNLVDRSLTQLGVK